MNTFLEEVKNHKGNERQHLVDRIIAQMSKEDADGLRKALLDCDVKLVAIRNAIISRGFQISHAHLSLYRTELRNGVR